MLRQMKNISLAIIVTLFGMFFLNSCVNTDFSAPEYEVPVFDGEANTTIAELKQYYQNGTKERGFVTITDDLVIKGYVVSSDLDGNFYKNLVIQGDLEGNSEGIQVSIDQSGLASIYPIGQLVYIKCKDLVLGKYGNEVQLGAGHYEKSSNDFRLSPISSVSVDLHLFLDGEKEDIQPRVISIGQLSANNKFTYLKIENVQFTTDEDQTWGNIEGEHSPAFPFKSTTITDINGNELTVFTSNYARFAGKNTPKGSGSITGILGFHNGNQQFIVNSIDDVHMDDDRFVVGGAPVFTIVDNLSYDFSDQVDRKPVRATGWYNIKEEGRRDWIARVFNNNPYAQFSGYNSGDASNVAALITPAINVSTQKVLSFQTAKSFWAHEDGEHPLEVLYSSDFDGENYATATWTPLSATIAQNTDANNAWIDSGDINLPVIAGGHVSIAFRYSGSETASTTIRIDNLEVN